MSGFSFFFFSFLFLFFFFDRTSCWKNKRHCQLNLFQPNGQKSLAKIKILVWLDSQFTKLKIKFALFRTQHPLFPPRNFKKTWFHAKYLKESKNFNPLVPEVLEFQLIYRFIFQQSSDQSSINLSKSIWLLKITLLKINKIVFYLVCIYSCMQSK